MLQIPLNIFSACSPFLYQYNLTSATNTLIFTLNFAHIHLPPTFKKSQFETEIVSKNKRQFHNFMSCKPTDFKPDSNKLFPQCYEGCLYTEDAKY